ncbi:GYDIA family GHMP kinase [Mariniflexile aquimaris]|uniref:GYDIA family GHMP kinase n=1 Tax=Mariniflexile aquimaris TaxID=881009 RepID=A0ABW3BX94_9FLAO
MQKFYSNGKLLITGEYVVLDGALSLALPTKYGQSLQVETFENQTIVWESYDEKGQVWFEDTFSFNELASGLTNGRNDISNRIIQILKAARLLNPEFLSITKGIKISTHLTFPRNWGLGTSSTLINNVAQWTQVDAYKLLENTFGGSGYDIACAQHKFPLTYQLKNSVPHVNKIDFNPTFKNNLYFVYLNKKQNSRDGIASFKANKGSIDTAISEISDITNKIIQSKTLLDFDTLITQHEVIISKIIKQQPVKELLFNDYNGSIKSLGAWGGDFILVTAELNPSEYFKNKGYHTIIPYKEMVLL